MGKIVDITVMKMARMQIGMSQSDLGDIVGADQAEISRWETNMKVCPESTTELICKLLHISDVTRLQEPVED